VEPATLLPIIALLSLVSVEFGGWALLGYFTGRGGLGGFRERFFRAGHAHAGVPLVLSLVYFLYLERTGYSDGVRWLAGLLLIAGILAQSGGFFIHLGHGRANQSSLGTVVTRSGALLIGLALIMLVVGLLTGG
jgi:fucose 4-O-acetylase-like acetyltransferase